MRLNFNLFCLLLNWLFPTSAFALLFEIVKSNCLIIILTIKKNEKVKTPINYARARVAFLLPRKIHLCKNHLFQIINNCRESIKSIQPLLFLECLGWQGRYLPFKVNVSRKKNKLYRKIIFYMIFWNQLGLKFWKKPLRIVFPML